MPRLPESFSLPNNKDLTLEGLLNLIETMYRDLAIAVNRKPDIITRQTDGLATETFLSNGDININLSSDKVEMLTNHTSSTNVTWTQLSP